MTVHRYLKHILLFHLYAKLTNRAMHKNRSLKLVELYNDLSEHHYQVAKSLYRDYLNRRGD